LADWKAGFLRLGIDSLTEKEIEEVFEYLDSDKSG
jgi:hypothetical protein